MEFQNIEDLGYYWFSTWEWWYIFWNLLKWRGKGAIWEMEFKDQPDNFVISGKGILGPLPFLFPRIFLLQFPI